MSAGRHSGSGLGRGFRGIGLCARSPVLCWRDTATGARDGRHGRPTPTLVDWAGRPPAMARLIDAFYDRLPADPEFRAALVSYLEWGTRLAVGNSQPDA